MWTLLRLATREIRNHPRFSAFFALNLALGFAGFVALDAFERSVSAELLTRSKAFLGADLAVTASRPIEGEEAERFDRMAGADARVARVAELYSMVAAEGGTRLIEVHAIDEAFPLRGAIVLERGGHAGPEAREALSRDVGVWIDPPLVSQLALAIGERLRIGNIDFVVQDVVLRDGGRTSAGFSIAPRVYVNRANLERTGLISQGSRVRHRRLYALGADADPDIVARAMRAGIEDPRVSVRSHGEATRDLTRTFGAVSDYLGMVSLVAVFLAGLGAAYLFRAFLSRRIREVGILLCLGATRGRAQAIFLLQLVLLSTLAAALACGLGALLLPMVVQIAGELTPPGFSPRVGLGAFAVTAVLATLGSTAACLPLIARLRRLRPAELFAEQAAPTVEPAPGGVLLGLPGLLFVFFVAVWRAESLWVGGIFAAVVLGSLAGLAGIGWLSLRALGRLRPSALTARLAVRELVRRRTSNVAAFVAIALCTLLVSVPPQMRGILESELETPKALERPSLFLFDIQPDQLAPLEALVAEGGSRLDSVSPTVRAQLASIGGVPVTRPRGKRVSSAAPRTSDDQERRLRYRRYNLTYRSALTGSERLLDGRDFSGSYEPVSGEPAELSLEVEFAEQLGLDLGDTLTFDVQGVPVEGRVVNVREVKWSNFQPNFFVAFQPGVLEDAPAVFLASIPHLAPGERESLQTSIVDSFPNVSVIDVTRAVQRVIGLIEQLHWAISSTASLSLLVGLVLIFAIARDRAQARRWETNLLKVLGAEFLRIRRAVDLEFGLLAGLASLAGAAGALIAAAVLCRSVLQVPFHASWGPLATVLVAVPLVCVLTGRVATRSVLREKPLTLLQAAS